MERKKLARNIEKYHATVFRVALGYVKTIADAEDITQEVFLKLFKHNKDFATEEALKAWLIRVTINMAKDMLKSVWAKQRADLDESLVMPENGTEEEFGLYEYVKNLKPKYRTAIYLYYYEEYNAAEISKILKIPQSTVETHLHRGREKLKKEIVKEERFYGKLQTII